MSSRKNGRQGSRLAAWLKAGRVISSTILIGAVLHVGWLNYKPSSWARGISSLWWDGKERLVYTNYEQVDNLFSGVTANGNVLLRLKGFNPALNNQVDFANTLYYRGTYAIFPKRAYAVDEATPADGLSQSFMSGSFAPTADWIIKHHAVAVVTVELDSQTNQVRVSVSKIPEASQ